MRLAVQPWFVSGYRHTNHRPEIGVPPKSMTSFLMIADISRYIISEVSFGFVVSQLQFQTSVFHRANVGRWRGVVSIRNRSWSLQNHILRAANEVFRSQGYFVIQEASVQSYVRHKSFFPLEITVGHRPDGIAGRRGRASMVELID